MDSTPGAAARSDSRSLSVEAAQYDAEASYAEAEIRHLEEKMEAARAKANKARLQKQHAEAAGEDAFQQEREERQAIVRKNITDHHIQGMRKTIKLDRTQHLLNDLKKVAAGDIESSPNAIIFVGAMVLRELVGHDDQFLAEIAGNVLADPVVTTTNGLQQSQGFDVRSKHEISPKLALASPSPTTTSPRLFPKSAQLSLTSPGLTLHGEDEIFALGNDGTGATGSLQGDHEVDAGENSLRTEAAIETPETVIGSEEQGEAEVGAIDVDIDEKTGSQQVVLAEGALEIVALDKENDTATGHFNDESSPAEESFDTMAGVEYSVEQDEVPASNARSAVFKQEPSANLDGSSNTINAIAALARLKRQSTETANSHDLEIVSSPLAVFHRAVPTTQEEEPTLSHPQTPQPATPNPKKKLAGLDVQRKAATAGRKPSGKRKRQDSEVSIPAAGESSETTTTAAKKGKTKAKDENAVPKRVADFVRTVKTLSSASQSEAILCSICGAPPKGPRLSYCLHMYCETCWKSTSEQAKQSGKMKFSEQPCMREGCKGMLGKAVMIPMHLNILSMGSAIWTGQKAKSGLVPAEDDLEGMDADEESIEVDVE